MTSHGSYTPLPDDADDGRPDVNQHQPGAAASSETSDSARSAGRGAEQDARGVDEKSSSGGEKRASGDDDLKRSSADPTEDSLPTAEGVFVGDPVTQPYDSRRGGAARATVIASQPPTYQNHVLAAAATAAEGGDGRGIAIPNRDNAQHTVIVMNGLQGYEQLGEWGRHPQAFVCQACGFSGLTATSSDPCSNAAILAAACCCFMGWGACSFIPFLMPGLRDTVHRCPNCQFCVGRTRQF